MWTPFGEDAHGQRGRLYLARPSAATKAGRCPAPRQGHAPAPGEAFRLAREILAENPVEQGLICVLKVVEPCMTFEYHRSPNREERGLRLRLLRARGIIRKIPKTYRYKFSKRGQLLTSALFAVREADINQLLAKAA
jgi:hypothetical protein